jgi:hypothetical protein
LFSFSAFGSYSGQRCRPSNFLKSTMKRFNLEAR